MRLFVCNQNNQKVYLDVTARNRKELASKIGFSFMVLREYYNVNNVFAEASSNDTAAGALIGGLIGLLGGGIGVLLGGVAGGLAGNTKDDQEKRLVYHFNQSTAPYGKY